MSNREMIIQAATQLISNYGAEQLSLKQVAVSCGLKLHQVTGLFVNPENLVVCCLEKASQCLSWSMVSSLYFNESRSILSLWESLVEFNCLYKHESRLIVRFLRSPSLFPPVEIKSVLLRGLDKKLKTLHHELVDCNDSIRLATFSYLMQMAFTLSAKLPAENDQGKLRTINDFFFNRVESHLNSLVGLPIC